MSPAVERPLVSSKAKVAPLHSLALPPGQKRTPSSRGRSSSSSSSNNNNNSTNNDKSAAQPAEAGNEARRSGSPSKTGWIIESLKNLSEEGKALTGERLENGDSQSRLQHRGGAQEDGAATGAAASAASPNTTTPPAPMAAQRPTRLQWTQPAVEDVLGQIKELQLAAEGIRQGKKEAPSPTMDAPSAAAAAAAAHTPAAPSQADATTGVTLQQQQRPREPHPAAVQHRTRAVQVGAASPSSSAGGGGEAAAGGLEGPSAAQRRRAEMLRHIAELQAEAVELL